MDESEPKRPEPVEAEPTLVAFQERLRVAEELAELRLRIMKAQSYLQAIIVRPVDGAEKRARLNGLDELCERIAPQFAGTAVEADFRTLRSNVKRAIDLAAATEMTREEAYEQAKTELLTKPPLEWVQAAADLDSAFRALSAARAEVLAQWESDSEQLERDLTEAAFVLARQVIGQELKLRPELILDNVREALSKTAPEGVTVRLNPQDMPIVMAHLIELQEEIQLGDVAFDEDPAVERGGCLVTTGHGDRVTGTVDTQPGSKLDQLKSAAEG